MVHGFLSDASVDAQERIVARKKGTIVPKKGTIVHLPSPNTGSEADYAIAVAAALRRELGDTRQAIKSARRWTGASERTVKYWFNGSRGPRGEHLIALARHSDEVLEAFLDRAGRRNLLGRSRVEEARDRLRDLLVMIQEVLND
jgi:hypothetical protein